VSVSKLLQQGNGSRITPLWQAKPVVRVKFELKSKCLARHCPALADSPRIAYPLIFGRQTSISGSKSTSFEIDGKRR
jgi:hypothetical protein